MIDDIFLPLGLDKCEWLEDIEREDSSLSAFMSCVEECNSERECRKFEVCRANGFLFQKTLFPFQLFVNSVKLHF